MPAPLYGLTHLIKGFGAEQRQVLQDVVGSFPLHKRFLQPTHSVADPMNLYVVISEDSAYFHKYYKGFEEGINLLQEKYGDVLKTNGVVSSREGSLSRMNNASAISQLSGVYEHDLQDLFDTLQTFGYITNHELRTPEISLNIIGASEELIPSRIVEL